MNFKDIKGQIKDLDWKTLLLEKGEKIGLGVAGVITGLMVLPFLWYMVAGTGPSAHANQLAKPTGDVEAKLNNRSVQPSGDDSPPVGETQVVVKNLRIGDGTPYQLAQLTSGSAGDPTKRRQPAVLALDSGIASVVRVQIESYVLDLDKKTPRISVVEDRTATTKAGAGDKKTQNNPYSRGGMTPPGVGGMAGGPGGKAGAGGPGGGGPAGMRPGGMGGAPPSMMGGGREGRKDLQFTYIPLEKYENQVRQEKVLPVRMVEIAASFPYRQQMEEFQRKLNLPTFAAVREDVSGEVDKVTKAPLPSFRFLGVNLQRVTLDPDGNPVGKWEEIDLNNSFKALLYLNGERYEDESKEVDAISFVGLVMPRLKSKEAGQYANIETSLENIQKTLDALIKAQNNLNFVAPKNPLDLGGDFDIFKPRNKEGGTGNGMTGEGMPNAPTMPGGKGGPGGGPIMPGGPAGMKPGSGGSGPKAPPGGGAGGPMIPGGGPAGMKPGTGGRGPVGPGGEGTPGGGVPEFPGGSAADGLPPDYCLVRVMDITVVPGTTYRYRLQVKMANPNKNLSKNVLSPRYAQDPFLLSDWFELPQNVVVPPEVFVYAVDQKDALVKPVLDPTTDRDYQMQNAGYPVQKERQMVFQMHKWLQSMPLPNNENVIADIGEWVVAERVPVFRGEYLGRNQRVQVPAWKSSQESFVLMTDPKNTNPRLTGVPVNFSQLEGSDLILVDFDGGEVKYDRAGKTVVTDKAAAEAVLLSPEGKLLVRDSVADAKDAERVKRLEEYRKRIKDVKAGGKDKPGDTNPFGGPKGGGGT